MDLGGLKTIGHVLLTWEDAYAGAHSLQVSRDGKTWTSVATDQGGQGGVEGIDFTPVAARWVRMYGTKRATPFSNEFPRTKGSVPAFAVI